MATKAMKTYGEDCPIATGAEAIGDRWTRLVGRRELIRAFPIWFALSPVATC